MPLADRYDTMRYNRCGRSGLKLPAISLGLWHLRFVRMDVHANCEDNRSWAAC